MVAAEIITGRAITAALPTIISIITNLMNATAVISIADTIAKAAGYIATYLTQGWAKNIPIAAVALATVIAMGLVELVMALGFKGLGKGIKKAGTAVKQGIKTAAKGTSTAIKAAAKGIKSLLKSGAKLVSRTGSMLIRNGKLVIKGLQKGFANGIKKLSNLIGKLLEKYRFKSFEFEREGDFVVLYGIINPRLKLAKWKYKGKQLKIKNADDTAKALTKQELEALETVSDRVHDVERSKVGVSKVTGTVAEAISRINALDITGVTVSELKAAMGGYVDETIETFMSKFGTSYKSNPLRQAYESEVNGLSNMVNVLRSKKMPEEQIATTVSQARRDLGIKYKNDTPPTLRNYIYDINIHRYDDPLGPTFDRLYEKYDGDYTKIIEAACRPNPDVDKLLGGFKQWLTGKLR